jgi:hypothetical protein
MARSPDPPRVEVDGIEMVALDVGAYQQLRAYRGQVGALTARLHGVQSQLDDLSGFLDELTRLAQAVPACSECPGVACPTTDIDCPRRMMLTALADRPQRRPPPAAR